MHPTSSGGGSGESAGTNKPPPVPPRSPSLVRRSSPPPPSGSSLSGSTSASTTTSSSGGGAGSSNYISSLVNKSTSLLDSLKHQYTSLTGTTATSTLTTTTMTSISTSSSSALKQSASLQSAPARTGGAPVEDIAPPQQVQQQSASYPLDPSVVASSVSQVEQKQVQSVQQQAVAVVGGRQTRSHNPSSSFGLGANQLSSVISGGSAGRCSIESTQPKHTGPTNSSNETVAQTSSTIRTAHEQPAAAADQTAPARTTTSNTHNKPTLPPKPMRPLQVESKPQENRNKQIAVAQTTGATSVAQTHSSPSTCSSSLATTATPAQPKPTKHKRASSIRSALRHAHIGRKFKTDRREKAAAVSAAIRVAAAASSSTDTVVKSKPYELFEPPITQRTIQRSRRRGAMHAAPGPDSTSGCRVGPDSSTASTSLPASSSSSSAPAAASGASSASATGSAGSAEQRRSVDTMVGLRQLTDEYLRNAGVKPGARCQLVSLTSSIDSAPHDSGADLAGACSVLPGEPSMMSQATTSGSSAAPTVEQLVGADPTSSGGAISAAQYATIEAQLYQASRSAEARAHQLHSAASASSKMFRAHTTAGGSTGGFLTRSRHVESESVDSMDSMSKVTVLPGNLPWQSDVCIQCELLPAPPLRDEPQYETTGDVLETLAAPYRGVSTTNLAAAHLAAEQASASSSHALSATLRHGLSAISQHHLSPGGASSVVGSLKKSLSNTLDVGLAQAARSAQHHYLHSQDSLPAYSSLRNEATGDDEMSQSPRTPMQMQAANSTTAHQSSSIVATAPTSSQQAAQASDSSSSSHSTTDGSGLKRGRYLPKGVANDSTHMAASQSSGGGVAGSFIGQLASRLSRQSSKKKFSVSKTGLHRALSFDCRNGYKRLERAQQQQQQQATASRSHLAASHSATGANSTTANTTTPLANSSPREPSASQQNSSTSKSTLGIEQPRPYLPSSASQVDFQVPLLPYERMQEAIVSQRLLGAGASSSAAAAASGAVASASASSTTQAANSRQHQQQQQQQASIDELMCVGSASSSVHQSVGARFGSQVTRSDSNLNLGNANDSDGRHYGAPQQTDNRLLQQQRQQAPALVLNIPTIEAPASNNQRQQQRNQASSKQPATEQPISSASSPSAHLSRNAQAAWMQHQSGTSVALATTDGSIDGDGTNYIGVVSMRPCLTIERADSPAQCEVSGLGMSLSLGPNSGGNGAGTLSQSPSFCIDPTNKCAQLSGDPVSSTSPSQLTANDVFARSKSFIKRPSTMMSADEEAMNQIGQALESANSQNRLQSKQQPNNQRTSQRRQAIVPPKLATDLASSDTDTDLGPEVGQLVEIGDAELTSGAAANHLPAASDIQSRTQPTTMTTGDNRAVADAANECGVALSAEEAAALRSLRRKRSGGSAGTARALAVTLSGPTVTPASTLPTFKIEPESSGNEATSGCGERPASSASSRRFGSNEMGVSVEQMAASVGQFEHAGPTQEHLSMQLRNQLQSQSQLMDQHQRPDSQATNADSIVSSGSTNTLSPFGARSQSRAQDQSATNSNTCLAVPNLGAGARRRSSIAVIPQMQICPGDLLVYSKQLIDRMNQSEEIEPPQFLVIDDKKGKNIWSSFKLCAQFDTRTVRARNELLGGLEDVLASLQPSTFVDEQLSHYKGMNWDEFLYETESRHSTETINMIGTSETALQPSRRSRAIDELASISVEPPAKVHGQYVEATPTIVTEEASPVRSPLVESPSASSQVAPVAACNSHPVHRRSLKDLSPVKSALGGSASGNQNKQPLANESNQSPTVSARPSIRSRFKEKPRLKRGQTVDSVFRIPLIPSSPLKHAQVHQQTPTAHLEHDMDLTVTLEDEGERSSLSGSSSATSGWPTSAMQQQQREDELYRRKRSSSTRSRTSLRSNAAASATPSAHNHTINVTPVHNGSGAAQLDAQTGAESSFEADDANGGETGVAVQNGAGHSADEYTATKGVRIVTSDPNPRGSAHNQIVRQSSLSTISSTVTRTEQKRQRALWDLFQSECTFFFDHLLALKNVYMEPLKKIQVEGYAMLADPDILFGNLDELCCGVYDFCKEFLYIIMRTLRTRPEELNATDVLIKLYKKNPKIDHLRAVYHRYTLNYINALTYLETLRRQIEFVEFEKWSSRDVRCKKLQLTDLLVAPVQHIMRVPIILKDIESHTENARDRDEIRAILAVEEASLRELDDKMRWLKNFERLLEIQKNIQWPSVLELDAKLFVPEFLKEVLSKQPCEKLIVSPRRQIVHEGTLSNYDTGKPSDMHVILFDDMLLLTRRKKGLTKKASTVCKTNSGSQSNKDDGSFKYIVYKQPLSLDRFYVHNVQQIDSQAIGIEHLFLLIVMNRFQQITSVHSFSAPNDDIKQTWLFKLKKTSERWKKNFLNSNANDSSSHHQQQQQQQTTRPAPVQQVPPRAYLNNSSSGNIERHQSRTPIEDASTGRATGRQQANNKINCEYEANNDNSTAEDHQNQQQPEQCPRQSLRDNRLSL